MRRRRGARRAAGAAARGASSRASRRASRCARSRSRSTPACSGSAPAWRSPPRCCSPTSRACRRRTTPTGLALASGSVRITPGTNRRLRAFATTQIAFSFVLLAGAGTLLATLVALQTARHRLRHAAGARLRSADAGARHQRDAQGDGASTRSDAAGRRAARRRGRRARQLRAVARRRRRLPAVPVHRRGLSRPPTARRIRARGCGSSRPASSRCSACRSSPAATSRDDDRARQRAGRDRQPERRRAAVRRTASAVNRTICGGPIRSSASRARAASSASSPDVDDEHVVRGPGAHDLSPGAADAASPAGCSCTPRAIRMRWCRPITRIDPARCRPNQPVERAATLEDVRAEVLAPERLNAFVLSGFAGVALLIAVVGVAGVLAFSVQRADARVRRAAGPRLDAASPAAAACCRKARASSRSASSRARPAATLFARVAASYRRRACRLPGRAADRRRPRSFSIGAAVLASLMPAARRRESMSCRRCRSE